jgi:PAS domain S-box-containing protein
MDQIFGIDNTYEKSVEGWLDIIHPDDRDMMNEYLYDEVVGKRLPFNKEYRILRKNDGEMRWIHGMGKVGFDENNNLISLVGTIQDIHDRKLKEDALRKLNKTLAALSKSSQIMAQTTDEAEYLNKVCDIIVDDTDFTMVWIGYAEEDEAKTIRPVASAGFNDDYLDNVKISWADNEFGCGPSGVAVRTGKMAMCNNMFTDPDFEPWRDQALKRGFAASIVFPLKSGNKTFGAITIYAKEPDSFLEDEIKLLSKLSSDLAHGIITIRLRKAQEMAELALHKSHSELSVLVEERTAELVEINRTLSLTEEKYRTIADFTYNMETWMDASGKYIYVSPSCLKITGYTADEFMNDPNLFVKIAHPDDCEMVENHFKEDMTGTVLKGALEFRIITKSGMERWIGHSCQPVYSTEGMLLGQRGSNRNITKQKIAELILVDSEKHLRALTQRMDEVAEEERIRISREIHDEIGHLLTALKYDTEGLTNHLNNKPEQIKEELSGMISMIDALIDTVRKIATELRPGILDHMGLLAAIEWKIKQFRLKNKICCEYDIEEMDVVFTKNETTFIYRILQEIFTNVTRHSKATHLLISIGQNDGNFVMKVTDNGVGFDVQASLQKGSLGLMGIRERAKSIGGEIQIESFPGKGTITTFILKK